ncbi:LacI family DNA-binding transcriptional regulator [Microbacterium sp. 179-B 1A2 NHS]|uniref:CGNR zinc finger domain-containing protein n=1 Tax=Microbacterium sp. 179-B 1A2 NHS TaxID=3142383 RepID=UPI0039A3CC4A
MNSVEWQEDEDAWVTPADLSDWLRRHTDRHPSSVTADDLALARRIREGLREVFLTHAGHAALPTSIDDLNHALTSIPLRLNFTADGTPRISAHASSEPVTPLIVILEALATARTDGGWNRLKACSRDSCRWAYWDSSRNASGRWCSMAGCGNYIKMRRRNDAEGRSADTIPAAECGTRTPRLIDVAGRAGVSIKTVSNVVNGASTVADSTRLRVQAIVDELGYRPNLAARELATSRGRGAADPPSSHESADAG